MAITRLIGDVHGVMSELIHCVTKRPDVDRCIQVGDLGVGFNQGESWHQRLSDFMVDNNVHAVRGNHDNPAMIKNIPNYIPDGKVEDDVMFIGGAWSIDNPDAPPGWWKRTKDVDWWEDEECSEEEFARIFDIYSQVKPRVMVTHDCPHNVAGSMFWGSGFLTGPRYSTRTGDFLQKLYEIHQPKFWFFGHWHKSMVYVSKTNFVCLGIYETVDVDLADDDSIYDGLKKKFL